MKDGNYPSIEENADFQLFVPKAQEVSAAAAAAAPADLEHKESDMYAADRILAERLAAEEIAEQEKHMRAHDVQEMADTFIGAQSIGRGFPLGAGLLPYTFMNPAAAASVAPVPARSSQQLITKEEQEAADATLALQLAQEEEERAVLRPQAAASSLKPFTSRMPTVGMIKPLARRPQPAVVVDQFAADAALARKLEQEQTLAEGQQKAAAANPFKKRSRTP